MGKKNAFSDWVLKEPATRKGTIGVLANSARSLPSWPKGAGKEEVWDFIVRNGEEFRLARDLTSISQFRSQR